MILASLACTPVLATTPQEAAAPVAPETAQVPVARPAPVVAGRDDDLDLLTRKFAELLAQQRARAAARAAGTKPPGELREPALPQPSLAEAATGADDAAAKPRTIEVLVLRSPARLEALPRMNRIVRLILAGEDITNAALRHLEGLSVEELSIEATHVTNAGLRHVALLKDLRCLRLWTPAVDDEALTLLAALPALETLDIEGTSIAGVGLEQLRDLQQLETLILGPRMPDAQMVTLTQLPALRQLDLRPCRELTLASLGPLAQLVDLKKVWLPGHIRTKGARILAESLPECEVH